MADEVQKTPVRYRTNPNFLMREIGGESVLVPVDEAGVFENSMLSLNRSSSFLWKVFQTPHTIQEAIEQAEEQFSAPPGEIERDVKQFVKDHTNFNLLVEE